MQGEHVRQIRPARPPTGRKLRISTALGRLDSCGFGESARAAVPIPWSTAATARPASLYKEMPQEAGENGAGGEKALHSANQANNQAGPERWPSGRRRSPAKGVYVKSVSRVRIPSSPPLSPVGTIPQRIALCARNAGRRFAAHPRGGPGPAPCTFLRPCGCAPS